MGSTAAEATPGSDLASRSATFRRSVVPRVLGANFLAAAILFLYLVLVSPTASQDETFGLEVGSFVAYVIGAMAVGIRIGKRTFAPVAAWLDEDRPPTQDELQVTLEQPLRHARWVFAGWAGGALLFAG